MKTFLKMIPAILVTLISLQFNAQAENRSQNRLLPEKLRGIDNGIEGAHFPNPTYATYEDGFYFWKHDTSVKSLSEDLQITEYGSYIYTDKGWILRVTFTPEDFAKTYKCKDAILKKGKIYTDPASWRRSEKLTAGDAMWYFIAKNKSGKLFKGTALIETEAKLVSKTKDTSKKVFLDSEKSIIKWTGYAEVGSYSLTGSVKLKSGELTIIDEKIVSGKIIVDLSSIDHSDANLKQHLKGEDFFNTELYPEAILLIKSSKKLRGNLLEVSGTMTIKATTKSVTFNMKPSAEGYSGKIKIDRTAFGVQYGSKSFFDNLGDRAIRNDFDLEFSLKIK